MSGNLLKAPRIYIYIIKSYGPVKTIAENELK